MKRRVKILLVHFLTLFAAFAVNLYVFIYVAPSSSLRVDSDIGVVARIKIYSKSSFCIISFSIRRDMSLYGCERVSGLMLMLDVCYRCENSIWIINLCMNSCTSYVHCCVWIISSIRLVYFSFIPLHESTRLSHIYFIHFELNNEIRHYAWLFSLSLLLRYFNFTLIACNLFPFISALSVSFSFAFDGVGMHSAHCFAHILFSAFLFITIKSR